MKPTLTLLAVASLAAPSMATVWTLNINMSGLQEVPPNAMPGTGSGVMTYNDATNVFSLNMSVVNLTAMSTAQITGTKLYLGAAGAAGTLIDDLTVLCNWNGSNGSYGLFAPVQYTLGQTYESDLLSGNVFLNIHTASTPGGEIRGQFIPVPEPTTFAVVGLGALLLARRLRS